MSKSNEMDAAVSEALANAIILSRRFGRGAAEYKVAVEDAGVVYKVIVVVEEMDAVASAEEDFVIAIAEEDARKDWNADDIKSEFPGESETYIHAYTLTIQQLIVEDVDDE